MKRVNIAQARFVYEADDPAGYRSGYFRMGPSLGADRLGATVYELPPGQAICPYHYELAEEEWLLVLEGHPSLRHPGGTDRLEPWDMVCFATGPDGAHWIGNETDGEVRVLMFSTVVWPAVTVYPDSDKIGVYTRDKTDNVIVRRESSVGYWVGETD